MDNRKCRLCQNAEPTQTGSHIVSHFLIRRYENIDGIKERNYGIGFNIDGLVSKAHFGQSILPEKLDPVFGEISEEDILDNKHPLIEDHYFCPRCEKRMAVIENIYSESLSHFDRTGQGKSISSEIGLLLWCSIFWRLAEQNPDPMRFTQGQMQFMRSILNDCLPEPNTQPDIEKIRCHTQMQKLSYSLIRCTSNEKDNDLFFVHPNYTKPHALIIADQIVLFSLDGNYSDRDNVDFFGIEEHITQATINNTGSKESFSMIAPEILEILIKTVYEFSAKKRLDEL